MPGGRHTSTAQNAALTIRNDEIRDATLGGALHSSQSGRVGDRCTGGHTLRAARLVMPVLASVVAAGAVLASTAPAGAADAPDGPGLSVGDVVIPEPGSGTSFTAFVPVVLSEPARDAVTVSWRVTAGTLTARDLGATSGSVTIPAGQQSGEAALPVRGDRTAEGDEQAQIEMALTAGSVSVTDPVADVTVRDVAEGLSIGDVAITEPDSGSVTVGVPVVVVPRHREPLTFLWSAGTQDTGPADLSPLTSETTIPARASGVSLPFTVHGDTTFEEDETYSVGLAYFLGQDVPVSDPYGEIVLRGTDPMTWDTAWQPPAEVLSTPGSVFFYSGEPGEFVSRGGTGMFGAPGQLVTASSAGGAATIAVRPSDRPWDYLWYAGLQTAGERIEPGVYAVAHRSGSGLPGMEVTGDSNGCNALYGWFAVDEVAYDASGQLTLLEARWEQHCESIEATALPGVRTVRRTMTRRRQSKMPLYALSAGWPPRCAKRTVESLGISPDVTR
jgi:hypothetical protein